MKRRLHIDLTELADAMDNSDPEMNWYLDVETGDVFMVTDEMISAADQIAEDAEESGRSFADELAESSIPDGQKDEIALAAKVEEEFGARYLSVPEGESRDGFSDMEGFTETVKDLSIRKELNGALSRQRPFRGFKDVLEGYPAVREEWDKYQESRQIQRVRRWLKDEDIEVVPKLVN
jgi:hypothetical protein